MNIQHALEKSIEYENRLAEQMKIIERQRTLIVNQRSAIALLHARLSIADIKLRRARMDQENGPALLRSQAS